MFEKLVIVSRKTRLEDLVARFNSKAQAKFYIEHAGGEFADYEREDSAYRASLDRVRRDLDLGLKMQVMDRSFVPTYQFDGRDLVVAVGQDGLVANTAKYVGEQPIVGVNPDPGRFDGVLLPFLPDQARPTVSRVLEGKARLRGVTLAEAALEDGQRLVAFNDLFIGPKTHVSARYRIAWDGREEPHSSSGVVVSTGAGSTGWLSSIFNMAAGVSAFSGGGAGPSEAREAGKGVTLAWEDPRLV
ncbi:MAG: NAD+ kinase, partial [Planctomycetota bacterium]